MRNRLALPSMAVLLSIVGGLTYADTCISRQTTELYEVTLLKDDQGLATEIITKNEDNETTHIKIIEEIVDLSRARTYLGLLVKANPNRHGHDFEFYQWKRDERKLLKYWGGTFDEIDLVEQFRCLD